MKQAALSRMLGRLILLSTASLFSVLAGCSDNTTGPAPTDGNPPGSNVTILISDPVPASEADSVRNNVQRNSQDSITVETDQAIQTATAQYPNCELLGVNLNYDDDDELNYECVVRSGGKVYVVVVDPQSGEVKKKKEIDNYYYERVIVIRTVKVKVKDAKEKGRKVSNGDVVECNLEELDGRPTYVVVILTRENRYVTVFVDAEDGKERKIKDDGRCGEEKKKGKRGRGHYRHGKGKGYGHHHHCHCECDDDGNGGGDTTEVRDSVITRDSATTIVRSMMIDSVTIDSLELDTVNDSTAFYEFRLTRDSNKYEVVLDAYTGRFVSIKQTAGAMDSSEFTPVIKGGDTLVKLSVARTAATAQYAGSVQNWKLEYDATEAKWIYTFEIKDAAGQTKRVLVDAKTGLFIRMI